jgi:hypothetical protein
MTGTNDTNAKGTTMDAKTIEQVRKWVAMDRGNVEKTARWMAYTLKVAGIRQCRELIAEAMAA